MQRFLYFFYAVCFLLFFYLSQGWIFLWSRTGSSKQLETVVQDAGEALAEEKIRQEIQQVFHELGIEGGKIYIKIHEAGDGRISISECKVQLPQTYAPRHDEIQKALLQRLGERILLEYDVKSEE